VFTGVWAEIAKNYCALTRRGVILDLFPRSFNKFRINLDSEPPRLAIQSAAAVRFVGEANRPPHLLCLAIADLRFRFVGVVFVMFE